MNLTSILIVFAVIFGIFTCVILPAALYIRQNGMKGDLSQLFDRIETNMREYATFCEKASDIYKKVAVVEAELHAAKTRDASTQETIRNLGNKMNSRSRAAVKDKEPPETGKGEEEEKPNIEQLSMQFPGSVIPLQQPQQAPVSPEPRTRKFGEMPWVS